MPKYRIIKRTIEEQSWIVVARDAHAALDLVSSEFAIVGEDEDLELESSSSPRYEYQQMEIS